MDIPVLEMSVTVSYTVHTKRTSLCLNCPDCFISAYSPTVSPVIPLVLLTSLSPAHKSLSYVTQPELVPVA